MNPVLKTKIHHDVTDLVSYRMVKKHALEYLKART